jgi:hypothetical protein
MLRRNRILLNQDEPITNVDGKTSNEDYRQADSTPLNHVARYQNPLRWDGRAAARKTTMKCKVASYGLALGMLLSAQLMAQVTPIPEADFIPIQSAVTNIGPTATTLLVQKSYTLQQNEMRRVFGRVEITGNTGTSSGTGNNTDYASGIVECTGPNGFVGEGEAGQNYEGPNKAAGPDYPTTGHLVLYPLVLIQAPTTGTYLCKLFAATGKPETVVGTAFQGDNTTWLRVSAPIVAETAFTDAFTWGAPSCSETGGGAACLYVGNGAPPSVDVFAPEAPWSPAPDAAFVDVDASLQVTLCGSTSSCSAASPPQNKSETPVVLDSHLEFVQLNAAGAMCQTTIGPTQRSTISLQPHHYMIYHRLSTVPVQPSCGTPQFAVRLLVAWVSGGTAKIDGPGATHAIAFTSYRGTALPVPPVVGLDETTATNTLAASGYAAGVLSYLPSAAAAGTVISQDPAGGAIELPGSVVNLGVSAAGTAGVTVPNVLAQSEKTAIGDISSLGLAPSLSFKKACINPGEVLTQSPLPGTVVTLPTTVYITVDSGTYRTCVIK